MTEHTIDIEPTWVSVINMIFSGHADVKSMKEDLLSIAKVADIVRQAQKKGKTIKFNPDGTVQEQVGDGWVEHEVTNNG
ncbi:hypothetical protein ACFL96_19085 [Thermoproteota archaeon]